MPDDWYYRHIKITYDLNEFGHRCHSPNKVNYDNYILFIGCSHTFGVGLEYDKTYSYLAANTLNMSFYNMALGGSGIDTLYYNLSNWIQSFPLPKLVVVQWPDEHRFLVNKSELLDSILPMKEPNALLPVGAWHNRLKQFGDFYVSGLKIKYFSTKFMLIQKQIDNLCRDIPTIHLNFQNIRKELPKDFINIEGADKARDNGHYGNKTNESVSNIIVDVYNDKYLNARDNNDIRGQKPSSRYRNYTPKL